MLQANESALRSGAHLLAPASLRPTIYRPSRPVATPGVTPRLPASRIAGVAPAAMPAKDGVPIKGSRAF